MPTRFFLIAALLGCAVPPARAAEAFQTAAPFALLLDADTGSVLFDKNGDKQMAPASTTKILTAEIAFREIKEGRLKLDDVFLVSENAWRSGGAKSGGSTMFAALNSRIPVEDLIQGLVVQSGNDAAIALAEGISGSEDSFAALMNRRAHELGMDHSVFKNPWGRGDPNQRVTPRDMATLARHVIHTYPDFYRYFGEREFTWNRVRQLNRNPLLGMNIGADGLKTGDIAESGFGLVGSAVQNGERLIVVVNGLRTAKDRATESFKLLTWGFRNFEPRDLYGADEVVGTAQVFGGEVGEVPLVAGAPVKLLVPRGAGETLSGRITYRGPLRAPVQQGATVAELHVAHDGADILVVPLKAAAAVGTGSLPRRALDAGWELGATLIRQNFGRPPGAGAGPGGRAEQPAGAAP
ncbi:D-alanyl-D-alanine carboxypeptidase [Lichenibacterium minor]|uniref:serine-type D-Ala-D-Ala carboxypeptidase n=1 Tax=Lichenibacterium minor TaxID=2316528 RepID=A0A4Q2U9I2_9HYPH|nr:D-alanyl-D-alanine carboxypeptidase family protein [Lichenibacterium minor]RYC31757.1 D-alanyl-D-alanine carboxypeptidase [Lichenibacterium minor]